jgi:hypothetical protein
MKVYQRQFFADAAKWRQEWVSRIKRAALGAQLTANMLNKKLEAARHGATSFNGYSDPMPQIVFDLSNQIGELKLVFDSYVELRWPSIYSDEQ